jgi:hypothetical protein
VEEEAAGRIDEGEDRAPELPAALRWRKEDRVRLDVKG